MPKQLSLPPGEMHLLTIDRVVERDCDCSLPLDAYHGKFYYPSSDGKRLCLGNCPICHGTGKRKVRLRGWCEVGIDELFEIDSASEYSLDVYGTSISSGWFSLSELETKARDEVTKKLIAAHFDGTLPQGVAHIEEVDADD